MSFCQILNRNQSHGQAKQYLYDTSMKLRQYLQCWLATVLDSPWMYTHPIKDALNDHALFYPLALLEINHSSKSIIVTIMI